MFLALYAALFAMSAAAATEAQVPQWQAYADPAGHFSAEFPGTPKVEHTDAKSAEGKKTPLTQYSVKSGRVSVMVIVSDFTAAPLDPARALIGAITGITQNKQVANAAHANIDGHDGEFVVILDNGLVYSDQVFFVNQRLYQVVVVCPNELTDDEREIGKRFYTNFHFK